MTDHDNMPWGWSTLSVTLPTPTNPVGEDLIFRKWPGFGTLEEQEVPWTHSYQPINAILLDGEWNVTSGLLCFSKPDKYIFNSLYLQRSDMLASDI